MIFFPSLKNDIVVIFSLDWKLYCRNRFAVYPHHILLYKLILIDASMLIFYFLNLIGFFTKTRNESKIFSVFLIVEQLLLLLVSTQIPQGIP